MLDKRVEIRTLQRHFIDVVILHQRFCVAAIVEMLLLRKWLHENAFSIFASVMPMPFRAAFFVFTASFCRSTLAVRK